MKILLALGLIVGASTQAATGVFECLAKGDGLTGTIRLVDSRSGVFELWANGTRHACPLRVTGFDAQPGGVISQVILRLQREQCRPEVVTSTSQQLFDDIRLRVISSGRATLTARTQWLRFEQPAACEIKKINWKQLVALSRDFRNRPR